MATVSPTANVNTSPLVAAQISTLYGPQTQQALRRSQYLADALRQLQTEGGQSIRGGYGELGAKLLATALLQRANDKGQDALLKALASDQQAETDRVLAPITAALGPQQPSPPPATPTDQTSPQPAAPLPAQAQAPQVPPPASPSDNNDLNVQPVVTPQDRDALTRMIAVEAGGEGPVGMAAAAHVALNRLKAGYGGAKSLADVIYAPHQFEGIGRASQIQPQDYAAAQQVADAVLSGHAPDPTNGAINFLNPALQTQLGRPIPSWAQGPGQRIGNHVFFGGAPQPAQAGAMVASAAQAPGVPAPYQVASNGPTPPPPQSGSASPPAPQTAAPTPAALPPGVHWPTWTPSRQEYEYVQGLLMDPRTHALGVQEALKMRQKMTQPVEATVQLINGVPFYVAKDPTSGAPMAAIPVPPEAMTRHLSGAQAGVPGAPAGTQFDVKPTGDRSIAYQPPQGYAAGPNGALQYQRGGPADPTRPQLPAQGYQFAPQGGQQPIPGGPADPRAPANLLQGTQSIQKELRPIIDLAVVARQSFGAVQTGYQQQNGAGDIAMVNGLQHLIDKGVVRGEDVNMQMKANGLSGSIGSISQYLQSGGLLTPETRQKVLKTATDLFGNVNQQYRAQVMGYRQTVDNAYGQGAFDKFVLPPETAQTLGWGDKPGASPSGAPSPATFGPADAALAEAVRRGLPLSPQQTARARQLGLVR